MICGDRRTLLTMPSQNNCSNACRESRKLLHDGEALSATSPQRLLEPNSDHPTTRAVAPAFSSFRDDDHDDNLVLDRLRQIRASSSRPIAEQLSGVRRLLPQPDPDLLEEAKRWGLLSWRRMVVAILVLGFQSLDCNRHLITAEEQRAPHALRSRRRTQRRPGIHPAAEGACTAAGRFRQIELGEPESRRSASAIGLANSAMIAARRIAELDPYLPWIRAISGLRRIRRRPRRP